MGNENNSSCEQYEQLLSAVQELQVNELLCLVKEAKQTNQIAQQGLQYPNFGLSSNFHYMIKWRTLI